MGDGGGGGLDRHSRVSGNPTVACRQYHHKAVPFWIPAYAGMTVGAASTVSNQIQESCLSMFEFGFPLTREGR